MKRTSLQNGKLVKEREEKEKDVKERFVTPIHNHDLEGERRHEENQV